VKPVLLVSTVTPSIWAVFTVPAAAAAGLHATSYRRRLGPESFVVSCLSPLPVDRVTAVGAG
jgi:hypothetical protein